MGISVRAAFVLTFLCAGISFTSDIELVHATIYTEPGRPAIRDGAILIHGDRIVAVGTTTDMARRASRAGVTVYDCAGLTITAGFWNSHVHLLPPPLLNAGSQSSTALNAQMQTMFTRWGFTSVFDMASPLANTNVIRQKIAAGELIGPRILTTGEPFWAEVPIYVQRFLAENRLAMPVTTSAEEAKSRVDSQIRNGAEGIKIFAGSIEADRIILMPPDIAKAVVSEAHRRRRLVFSHPSSVKGAELSLNSGVDILAHVPSSEGSWPAALVRRMIAGRLSLVPTLTLFDEEGAAVRASPEERKQMIDLAVSQLRSWNSGGGQVLFGTDIGYIEHYDTAEELTLMSKAGMSFPQILASLTTTPAKRFGYAARSGRLMAGMDADLVLLRSDPAADVTAFAQVVSTIRGGRIIFGELPPEAANGTVLHGK